MARIVSPFSGRSLAEWIEVLQRAESADERYRALLAVKSLGSWEEAVAASHRVLSDDDAVVRALAAKVLGESRRLDEADASPWSEIAEALVARLSDLDVDVRFEAARALGRVRRGDAAAARDVLLSLLDEEDVQPLMLASIITAVAERSDVDLTVRESVSAAVAQWGVSAAALIEPLLIALDDEEPLVRENAALALGRSGVASELVASALRAAATDEDEVVASVARDALTLLLSE